MPKQKPIEIITPPNVLKTKLGGPLKKNSAELISRAERAVDDLSHEFGDWLDEELERVEKAWASARDLSNREEQLSSLYTRAHDLKGLASTYGYPIISRFANSLCRLIATPTSREIAPKALIDAHVKACRTAVLQNVKTVDHPIGAALANELEEQSAQYVDVA